MTIQEHIKAYRIKRWLKKQKGLTLDLKKKREVLKIFANPPVREYLIEMMRELVSEGIYLSEEKQSGARFTVDLLTKEIAKGDKVIKEDKRPE